MYDENQNTQQTDVSNSQNNQQQQPVYQGQLQHQYQQPVYQQPQQQYQQPMHQQPQQQYQQPVYQASPQQQSVYQQPQTQYQQPMYQQPQQQYQQPQYNTNVNSASRFSGFSEYYQRAFAAIEASGGTKGGGFNICAFLFGSVWALAKGAWLSALITILIILVTAGIAAPVIWILYGVRGNRIVYNVSVLRKQVIF